MISKIIICAILLQAVAFGFNDDDFDGVENMFDKCPNTNIDELVDITGCPKSKLTSRPQFDVQLGFNYYKNNSGSSNSTSFSANGYFDRLSVEVASSYPSSSQQDENEEDSDSIDISLFYKFEPNFDITTWLGFGVSIPTSKSTQNTEKSDYSLYLNCSKEFENTDLFGGVNYTFVNSKNTEDTTYQNTFGYYFGAKYYADDFISYDLQYATTKSEIADEVDISNLSFGTNYNLTSNWFARVELSAGLSESADDFGFSTKIGYSF